MQSKTGRKKPSRRAVKHLRTARGHLRGRRPAPPRAGPGRADGLAAFKKRVERAFESIEDRLDYLESEASLADGKPIPAAQVWKELGL